MQYHSVSDSYRPFQHLIAEMMRADMTTDATIEHVNAALPAALSVLYSAFRRSQPPQTPAEAFASFLARLKSLDALSPNLGDLNQAPKLLGWALAQHPTSLCSAIGYVTDHPQFRFGSPVVTSVVCRIDHDHQWVRTWNRFYRLEEYDASTLGALKTAGMLKSDVTLGTFGGAGRLL